MLDRAELVRNTSVRESLTLVGSSPWALALRRRRPPRPPRPQRAVRRTARVGEGHVNASREWLRPAAGAVAVVALVAAAAVLVALAADVLRWDRTMRDDDIAYAAHADAVVAAEHPASRGSHASGPRPRGRRRVPRRGRPVLEERAAGAAAGLHRRHATHRGRAAHRASHRDRGATPTRRSVARDAARGVPARGGAQLAGAAARVPPARDRAVPAGGGARSGATPTPCTTSSSRSSCSVRRAAGRRGAVTGALRSRAPARDRRARAAASEADGAVAVSFLTPLAAAVGLARRPRDLGARRRPPSRGERAASALGLSPAGRRGLVVDLVLLGLVGVLVGARRRAAGGLPLGGDARARRRGGARRLRRDAVDARAARAERADPARPQPRRSRSASAPRSPTRGSASRRSPTACCRTCSRRSARTRSSPSSTARSASSGRRPTAARTRRRRSPRSATSAATAFFRRETARRVIVVVSDGETLPVDLEALRERLGEGRVSTIFVQVWRGDEAVFDENGERDPAYRPDRTGGRTLRRVAGALEAPVLNEGDVEGLIGGGEGADRNAAPSSRRDARSSRTSWRRTRSSQPSFRSR